MDFEDPEPEAYYWGTDKDHDSSGVGSCKAGACNADSGDMTTRSTRGPKTKRDKRETRVTTLVLCFQDLLLSYG